MYQQTLLQFWIVGLLGLPIMMIGYKVKQLTRDHRDKVFVSEVDRLSQTVCRPLPHLKLFVAFLKTLALDERDLSTSGNFMSFELAIFENTNAFFL